MPPLQVVLILATALLTEQPPGTEAQELKLPACPPAVRKTFQAESKGAAIATVHKEQDDLGETLYWADATIDGRHYAIGVLSDGTLAEMNLAVDDEVVPLDRAPAAVQAALRAEAPGAKVEALGKDVRYGVTIYETVVEHKDRSYAIAIAEDGTLVEKALVIDDEEVPLAKCPAAVQKAFHHHAQGGTVREITRSTGIGQPTFEAEVETHGKVYLIELAENGRLLSKSLEAAAE